MIFKLKRKVEKGERNDTMTHASKPKAYFSINLNTQYMNGKTPFDMGMHVRLLDT